MTLSTCIMLFQFSCFVLLVLSLPVRMFYSHYVLTKKGPLAKVWLAATIGETRISKSFAASVKIPTLCGQIERPVAPFALRLSASLMLGVVRIYSRKSSILVADLSKILTLLSHSRSPLRLHSQSPASLHDQQNPALPTHSNIPAKRTGGFDQHPQISLPRHDTIANQEAITISVPPAKRRRIATRSAVAQTFSESAAWHPDIVSSIPEDLLTAMGLFFPTVIVPRQGEHVATAPLVPLTTQSPSQSNFRTPDSPSHREQSVLSVPWSDVRRAAFRAREEDIMLKESRLDDIFIEDPIYVQLSSDDQRTSNDSDTLGPVRRLFHEDITPDRHSVGRETQSHLQLRVQDRAPNNLHNVEGQNSHFDIFAPLDLEPLQIANFPMLTARQSAPSPSPLEAQGEVLASAPRQPRPHALRGAPAASVPSHSEVLPGENSASPSSSGARMSVRAPVSPTTVASPVSADEDAPPVLLPEETGGQESIPNKKVRRSMRVPMDLRTELDAEEFRANLLNPSDTLLPDGQRRTRGRHGPRGPRGPRFLDNIMRQTPSLIRRFAPEVADIWHEVTEEGWTSATSPVQSPLTRSLARCEVIATDDINAVNNIDNFSGVILGESEGPPVLQSIPQNNTAVERREDDGNGPSNIRSGSPELMREVQSDDVNRSVPSVSGGGRSGSQSVPSDTRSGKNERDRLFDIITVDDLKSYEDAKVLAIHTRGSDAYERLTPSAGGSSARRESSLNARSVRVGESVADEEQGQNLFNINTSELQLEEETEKDGTNDGEVPTQAEERWRIDTIGVKGFKLLELLRALQEHGNDVLATATQRETYGTIELRPGPFFQ